MELTDRLSVGKNCICCAGDRSRTGLRAAKLIAGNDEWSGGCHWDSGSTITASSIAPSCHTAGCLVVVAIDKEVRNGTSYGNVATV